MQIGHMVGQSPVSCRHSICLPRSCNGVVSCGTRVLMGASIAAWTNLFYGQRYVSPVWLGVIMPQCVICVA
jgi:hypothetical protein